MKAGVAKHKARNDTIQAIIVIKVIIETLLW